MNRDFASLSFLHTAYCPLPARDEQPMSWSQPELCTPVDIRWEKAQKVSLCLTFWPARRDCQAAKLDPQVASCQPDPI
jgi:hypothetical protein